ncbi:MAG: hypothetical protein JWM19_7752 [Actinomycetia bacterium]|nr:hypothetical protein [Actinomycetes bacterium]
MPPGCRTPGSWWNSPAKRARRLTAALDGLTAALPRARRVTLPGTGHTAADNGGKPGLVAAQLQAFLS